MTDPIAVSTPNAPAAIGPYEQAVIAGAMVFCSGQIALKSDGTLVPGDVQAEMEQVLDNLTEVLAAAGSGLDRLVRTTIFLTTMDDFAAVNEVYARRIPAPHPARACVAVSGLPKGVRVEMDAIALANL